MTSVIARTFYRWVGGNTTIPVTLNLGNIYILPTGYGILYLVVLGAMLIGSINYNNNLGFLLTFLLGSLGLTAMLHTYSMLYGLRLVKVAAVPVFAGTAMDVDIMVAGVDRLRTGTGWYLSAQDPVRVDFRPGEQNRVIVGAITHRRGRFDPGRLRIVCDYPLGLFRAWARINTDLTCLVYPRPVAAPMPGIESPTDSSGGKPARMAGVDDFQGLSAYQPGDPTARIHWQAYSRGRGLHIKNFTGQAGEALMLDMQTIKGDDTEKKLSILCFHVLQAHHQQRSFGMRLAGQIIAVGSGGNHRDRCLRALALYGEP